MIKNFLMSIRNSIGSQLFRNYLNEKDQDVLKNGDLSCAYFVSSILLLHQLIDRPHFTVSGTIFSMKKFGWYQIKKLRVGCIIIWEPIKQNGKEHKHIGVYVGEQQAISNRSSLGMPGEHAVHYSGLDKDGKKKKAHIFELYWHPALNKVK